MLRGLPSKPGVYIYKDEKGKVIYVGKAKDLKKRVSSYFSNKALDAKTLKLVAEIHSLDYIPVTSEIEAFLLESQMIKRHKPFYNIKLMDDKSYPYISITKAKNPAVIVVRSTNDKNAYYFGPYTDSGAVKTVLKLLRKIFPYQSVKNHAKRKCLYFHLGLCPCVLALPENLETYKKNLARIRKFLKGESKALIKDLVKEQKNYIKDEEFELASEIQKKIEYINHITSENYDPFRYLEQPDYYYQRVTDEKTSLESILEPYFGSLKLKRIECYDISNFQGKEATGSMVVFINGDKSSKDYRRFKIRTKDTPDDFFMMKEMLSRRFKGNGWEEPDLIVIDGGKGQVSSALTTLVARKRQIPLIGLAKREETIVIPQKQLGQKIEFLEVKLPKDTGGINLLRRIRDEAHRFAITYHRLLRKKRMISEFK